MKKIYEKVSLCNYCFSVNQLIFKTALKISFLLIFQGCRLAQELNYGEFVSVRASYFSFKVGRGGEQILHSGGWGGGECQEVI